MIKGKQIVVFASMMVLVGCATVNTSQTTISDARPPSVQLEIQKAPENAAEIGKEMELQEKPWKKKEKEEGESQSAEVPKGK